ncbi:hypothetical protein RFI_05356 [Reticulomyxa filosa]|uniref:K Homology domain-containing protein n=1 Tax=Reticulomyxa filosa TaxID=46433 RepID=X6P0K7_RETFI|nr:hypothetical protein RFI_05356 [Reticulomyxa filosa]|eukprot:ETO31761.1 hypothetical protein RFI_05356 [Reticulomyxa filosa]
MSCFKLYTIQKNFPKEITNEQRTFAQIYEKATSLAKCARKSFKKAVFSLIVVEKVEFWRKTKMEVKMKNATKKCVSEGPQTMTIVPSPYQPQALPPTLLPLFQAPHQLVDFILFPFILCVDLFSRSHIVSLEKKKFYFFSCPLAFVFANEKKKDIKKKINKKANNLHSRATRMKKNLKKISGQEKTKIETSGAPSNDLAAVKPEQPIIDTSNHISANTNTSNNTATNITNNSNDTISNNHKDYRKKKDEAFESKKKYKQKNNMWTLSSNAQNTMASVAGYISTLNNMFPAENTFHVRLLLDSKKVGGLIGKSGATITAIRKESEAKILIAVK